jgi:hypothetical protein
MGRDSFCSFNACRRWPRLWIAFRQWQLAQNKLKLELFDRRLAVYDAVIAIFASVTAYGTLKRESELTFLEGTARMRWLFNDEIAEYVEKEIWRHAIELQMLNKTLDVLPVGEARNKNSGRQLELFSWFRDQQSVLDQKLSPFLRLSH